MPDNILVATDLSIRSERALRRAAKLAEQHDARLTVLCIVDEDLPQRVATRMRDAMIEGLEIDGRGGAIGEFLQYGPLIAAHRDVHPKAAGGVEKITNPV